MAELRQVQGKTFLITGGASGLGAGYVESFLKDGAKSVAILDIAEEAGNAFVEKLNKIYPGRAIFIKCDCSNEESLTEAFNAVVNKFKTLDVLINNAGTQGMVSLTLKGIEHMSKDEGGKGGTIINVSSALGFLRYPFLPIYSGCKAGILHFSYSIAMDPFYAKTGVTVIAMCFGATETPLLCDLEKRSYNEKYGKLITQTDFLMIQKAESAVHGIVEAFKRGSNGSIWLSTEDKPAEDITPVISEAYTLIRKKLYPYLHD